MVYYKAALVLEEGFVTPNTRFVHAQERGGAYPMTDDVKSVKHHATAIDPSSCYRSQEVFTILQCGIARSFE